MSLEEKNEWIMGVVAIGAYAIYLVIILGRARSMPIAEVPYVATMLSTIGGAIAASILLNIVAGVASPRDVGKKDQRDREIYRRGEYIGQSFVVIGGVAAMVMAMARVEHFWIANATYLAFVLSAILGSVTKVVAYRRGFQSW